MIRWQPTWSPRHWLVLAAVLALGTVTPHLEGHPWWQFAAIIVLVFLMNLLPVPDVSSWARRKKSPPRHDDADPGEAPR